MMTDQNHYDVLGVPKSASPEEIRNAWRRLSMKNHPDRADLAEKAQAEARMRAINAAYECLMDPARRSAFDENRPEEDKIKQDIKDAFLTAVSTAVSKQSVTSNGGLVLVDARAILGEEKVMWHQQIFNLEKAIAATERAAKRITKKSGRQGANLVQSMLQIQVDKMRQGLDELQRRTEVLGGALAMLDDYDETTEAQMTIYLSLNVGASSPTGAV